jgi:hypothetical protein
MREIHQSSLHPSVVVIMHPGNDETFKGTCLQAQVVRGIRGEMGEMQQNIGWEGTTERNYKARANERTPRAWQQDENKGFPGLFTIQARQDISPATDLPTNQGI